MRDRVDIKYRFNTKPQPSLFGHFDQFLNFLVGQQSGLALSDNHNFNVLVARFHNVQQCLDHQFKSVFVRKAVFVVFLQKFTDLFWISAAALSFPFRERSGGVGVVEMGFCTDVESGDETADTEGSDSTFLSVLLFGFGDEFGYVLDGRAVVVVEAVALAFDSSLIGEDSSVCGQSRVCHVDVVVELNNFLDGSAFLQLGDCFFLGIVRDTYAARMTEFWVVRPTAQSPFLTA